MDGTNKFMVKRIRYTYAYDDCIDKLDKRFLQPVSRNVTEF